MANNLSYFKEYNIEIVKEDDLTITYTDDDDSVDFNNYDPIEFRLAQGVSNLYDSPTIKVEKPNMTINGNSISLVLPDTIDIGVYVFRWVFTNSSSEDITPVGGSVSII